MKRSDLLKRVADLGGSDVSVEELRDGWPGIIRVQGWSQPHRVAAHVGPVGLSHRGRDDVERRFQNPGQNRPVRQIPDALSVLLGVWEPEHGHRQPVFVGMEVTEDRKVKSTRQSYFVPLDALKEAQAVGWTDHVRSSDEHIAVFHPDMLPVYIEMRREGITVPSQALSSIARAAGLGEEETQSTPGERARRAAQVLVRDRRFARSVIAAYDGLCAMCGLNFGLLEGAHILPVVATGSPDKVWNGLALCGNHHSAFDRHRIWIDPSNLEITLHPKIIGESELNATCASFISTTASRLRPPHSPNLAPRREMFERRYQYFKEAYDWL